MNWPFIVVFVVLVLPALALAACMGWAFVEALVRPWVSPPSCSEAAAELEAALGHALTQRWETDTNDRGRVELRYVLGRHADRSSRSAVAAWAREVADLNPSPGASQDVALRIEHLARRAARVVEACE